MERVRDRAGGSTQRSARPGPPRSVPGTALKEKLYTESQRQTKTVGDCGAGRQDSPKRCGYGSQSDLRGGFSGFLLRVPARTQSAWGARCALCRHPREESELDTRHGPEGLFRKHRERTPDGNGREADRRHENPAIDPEMAQRGSNRRRRMVGDGEGYSARFGDFAIACERLPALRTRPVDRPVEAESARGCDHRPLRG